MYSLDELKKQNRDIAELISVLSVLLEHNELRTNPYVCELINRFREKVWMHLVFEDNTIYAALSQNPDAEIQDTVSQFHNSAKEIRKNFSHYIRHWCNQEVSREDAEEFQNESRSMFRLIMERVKYEDEFIFPLVAAQNSSYG